MSAETSLRAVKVIWIDSVGAEGWVQNRHQIAEAKAESMLVISLGFILAEEDDWILLTGSVMANAEVSRGPVQIPRVAIKEIIDLG